MSNADGCLLYLVGGFLLVALASMARDTALWIQCDECNHVFRRPTRRAIDSAVCWAVALACLGVFIVSLIAGRMLLAVLAGIFVIPFAITGAVRQAAFQRALRARFEVEPHRRPLEVPSLGDRQAP